MRLFLYISDFIVPFMILSILIYGIFAGVNVYDTFIQGAKRGFWTVVRLMPTLIGLMAAVGILLCIGFSGIYIGNNWKCDGADWISGGIGSAYDCENVFVLCSNGIIA